MGFDLCDVPDRAGWVTLCGGRCDFVQCSNVLDYFAKQGAVGSPEFGPDCASFTPNPLDVSGAGPGDSATRVDFAGGGSAGVLADWSVETASRY